MAGPRCCSHAANSPPDCSVEYASDSVIDARQRGRGRIDRPQHVVAHGGGLRPHLDAGGQLGDRGLRRLDGDHARVGDHVLAEGEGRVLQPRLGGRGRDIRCGSDRQEHTGLSRRRRTARQVVEINDEHGPARRYTGSNDEISQASLIFFKPTLTALAANAPSGFSLLVVI